MTKAESAPAVLYLRKSTEKQERSIDDQRQALIAYAAKHGYRIVGEYVDEAISGDDTDRRVGFQRMRDDVQTGKFSTVLAWDQDRFGRFDPIEAGFWILPFRKAGVKLETIGQGKIDWDDFAGRITYLVQQEAKHAFLRDLSRNICRAQLQMAKEGKGTGGNRIPYGYRVHQVRDERGKLLENSLEVAPAQARIVQRIFRDYLAGGSVRAIASSLNADKVEPPSPRARHWNNTTVAYILSNEKYLGRFVWGRQGVGRYNTAATGEIVARRKADRPVKGKPIVHEDAHEAIIDQDTFDQVRTRIPQQQKQTYPKKYRRYIFSGLLRCGDCGSSLVGMVARTKKGGYRYCCRRYGYAGTAACYCNSIAEAPLLELVTDRIVETYLNDRAIERIKKAILAEQQKEQAATRSSRLITKRIKEVDGIIEQAAGKILAAPPELTNTLVKALQKVKDERSQLVAELEKAAEEVSGPALDADEITQAIKALKNLRETVKSADRNDLADLMAGIIDRIELRFKHGRNGKLHRSEFAGGTVFLKPGLSCSLLTRKKLDIGQVWTFEISGENKRKVG